MSIAASEGEPELQERKIRLICRSGGSNAWVGSGSDGYAFPGHRKGRARVEKATVSRNLEVGRLVSRDSLCWFSAPCPGCLSPGRAWGAYRSWTAPFTARNRPANSSSLTTLGGAARGFMGVPPVERSVAMQVCPYTVSTRLGKPCLLFWACRYSSGLIRRGLCGLWRCCLQVKQVNGHRTLRSLLGPPRARSLHSTSLPYRGYVGGPNSPACTVSGCWELPSRLTGS